MSLDRIGERKSSCVNRVPRGWKPESISSRRGRGPSLGVRETKIHHRSDETDPSKYKFSKRLAWDPTKRRVLLDH